MKTSVRLSVISSVAILSLSAGAMAADPAKTFNFGGDVELDITADDGGRCTAAISPTVGVSS